jgi:hypothetical protein
MATAARRSRSGAWRSGRDDALAAERELERNLSALGAAG